MICVAIHVSEATLYLRNRVKLLISKNVPTVGAVTSHSKDKSKLDAISHKSQWHFTSKLM